MFSPVSVKSVERFLEAHTHLHHHSLFADRDIRQINHKPWLATIRLELRPHPLLAGLLEKNFQHGHTANQEECIWVQLICCNCARRIEYTSDSRFSNTQPRLFERGWYTKNKLLLMPFLTHFHRESRFQNLITHLNVLSSWKD